MNHVLDGGPYPYKYRSNSEGEKSRPRTWPAQDITTSDSQHTRYRQHCFDWGALDVGAHCCHLANMTESSLYGSSAALSQIIPFYFIPLTYCSAELT